MITLNQSRKYTLLQWKSTSQKGWRGGERISSEMVPCKSNAASAPCVCSGRRDKRFFDDMDLVGHKIRQKRKAAAIAGHKKYGN